MYNLLIKAKLIWIYVYKVYNNIIYIYSHMCIIGRIARQLTCIDFMICNVIHILITQTSTFMNTIEVLYATN